MRRLGRSERRHRLGRLGGDLVARAQAYLAREMRSCRELAALLIGVEVGVGVRGWGWGWGWGLGLGLALGCRVRNRVRVWD